MSRYKTIPPSYSRWRVFKERVFRFIGWRLIREDEYWAMREEARASEDSTFIDNLWASNEAMAREIEGLRTRNSFYVQQLTLMYPRSSLKPEGLD